jgi:hypothetical protein
MYNLTEEEKQKIHTALICASDSGTLDEFTKEELSLINQAESIVNKLTIPDVVKPLPNKEKLNFEDWLEFKKIDKLSDGAYRWEGSLYTEYYVKSSYETYLK